MILAFPSRLCTNIPSCHSLYDTSRIVLPTSMTALLGRSTPSPAVPTLLVRRSLDEAQAAASYDVSRLRNIEVFA